MADIPNYDPNRIKVRAHSPAKTDGTISDDRTLMDRLSVLWNNTHNTISTGIKRFSDPAVKATLRGDSYNIGLANSIYPPSPPITREGLEMIQRVKNQREAWELRQIDLEAAKEKASWDRLYPPKK